MTEAKARNKPKREPVPLRFEAVWKQVTPELGRELVDFWRENRAIDPERAAKRAEQAISIARDGEGSIRAVATAEIRVLPRLRQPMYYYRLFLSRSVRGQGQVPAFYNHTCKVLQDYNAGLDAPESLGVLIELENPFLSAFYKEAYNAEMNSTFIGYSPRGLHLRVTYFEGARLGPPAALRIVRRPRVANA